MASSLVVWSEGKRITVKVAPMAPLSKIVEEACKALKPPRDPSTCQLLLNKKQQDLLTPVRYANISKDAKLELHTGHQQRLGVQANPADQSLPSSSSQASQQPAPGATPSSSSSNAAPGPISPLSLPSPGSTSQNGLHSLTSDAPQPQHAERESVAEPMAINADRPPAVTTATAAEPETAQPSALPLSASSTGGISSRATMSTTPAQPSAFPAASNPSTQAGSSRQAPPSMQPAIPPTAAVPSAPSLRMGVSSQSAGHEPGSSTAPDSSRGQSGATVAGVDRPLYVFQRQQAISDAPADPMDVAAEEPGDAFFELTQDDLHRMMAGFNRSSRAGEGQGLKTAKMREQEAQQRAARLGPVPIRVQLPSGLTLQASFQATESLSAVHSFVKACLLPTIPSWYLYTTPPKQVLRDLRPTLFQAGLVPAAIVYLGISEPASQQKGGASQPEPSLESSQNGHRTGSQELPCLLRPEVEAAVGSQPQWQPKDQPQRGSDAVRPALSAAEKGKAKVTGGASGLAAGGEDKARKGPKWLKLGAK